MGFFGWFSEAQEAAAMEAQVDAMSRKPADEFECGGAIYVAAPEGEPWTCPDCGMVEEPDWCFHRCVESGYSGPSGVLL
jgi:hypothetical protein